jgi:oligopeptide/dipeptide ABC transporter ATP-binding protein
MYLGKIVEIADRRTLFASPHHPYTQVLLAAAPVPDSTARPNRVILRGDVPSPVKPPSGCRFHTRCPYAFDRCRSEEPLLRPIGVQGQLAACHLSSDPALRRVEIGSIAKSSDQHGSEVGYQSLCTDQPGIDIAEGRQSGCLQPGDNR